MMTSLYYMKEYEWTFEMAYWQLNLKMYLNSSSGVVKMFFIGRNLEISSVSLQFYEIFYFFFF